MYNLSSIHIFPRHSCMVFSLDLFRSPIMQLLILSKMGNPFFFFPHPQLHALLPPSVFHIILPKAQGKNHESQIFDGVSDAWTVAALKQHIAQEHPLHPVGGGCFVYVDTLFLVLSLLSYRSPLSRFQYERCLSGSVSSTLAVCLSMGLF